jgi:hypothetical protein
MRLKAILLASSVDLAQLVKDRQIASIEISGEDAFVTTREHEISAAHRARHQPPSGSRFRRMLSNVVWQRNRSALAAPVAVSAPTMAAPSRSSSNDAARRPGDERKLVAVLLLLTVVTGLVDATTYLGLGHVFAANMTDNVVLLAFALSGVDDISAAASLVSLAATGHPRGPHRRRYERLDITGLTGITDAQRTALLALGAVDRHAPVTDRPAASR